jgi:hypothetical protein
LKHTFELSQHRIAGQSFSLPYQNPSWVYNEEKGVKIDRFEEGHATHSKENMKKT